MCVLLLGSFIAGGVSCLFFIILNTAIEDIREAVFKKESDIIQFILFAFNFIIIVVGGPIVAVCHLCS